MISSWISSDKERDDIGKTLDHPLTAISIDPFYSIDPDTRAEFLLVSTRTVLLEKSVIPQTLAQRRVASHLFRHINPWIFYLVTKVPNLSKRLRMSFDSVPLVLVGFPVC